MRTDRPFWNLLGALIKILGFISVFVLECTWHLVHGRSDRIGDAFGETGRAIISTLVGVFDK
jgi:hypothetical protein